jgi:hypothetical protein
LDQNIVKCVLTDPIIIQEDSMATQETKRINPDVAADDTASYQAWQAIPGYQPNNAQYATGTVQASRTTLEAAQTAEVRAKAAYDAARDNAVKAEWDFHSMMLGVKDQVASQFGRNSNEYQALGLKKKTERKAPTRKKG